MRLLSALLILSSAICWWSAISGIEIYSTGTGGSHITYHPDLLSRVLAGVYGAFLVAFAVSIYRKAKFAWHVGLLAVAVFWAAFFFNTSIGIWRSEPPLPDSIKVILVVVGLGGSSLLFFLLGRWWYRQRGYFGAHAG